MNDSSIIFEDFSYTLGKGAEAEVSTVSIASNDQKQNITVRIENHASQSIGNIINYGIVKDTAHLAFNGIGKIYKGMNGVDNQQETRILNLSKTSEAVANPFLLIDEGDITAGHAATIGQINEEQIYYLMSRGLTRPEAQKVIASGFLTPFVDNNIEDLDLKKQLLSIIEQKLA
jgi:Fe-S cluster assembly protein SufD